MKKKLTWHGEDLCCQFFRKMKITLLLLLVSIASVYVVDSYAQATKLKLQLSDKAIKEVLYQVEEQSEFRFFYNENVNVEQKILSISRTKLYLMYSTRFWKIPIFNSG